VAIVGWNTGTRNRSARARLASIFYRTFLCVREDRRATSIWLLVSLGGSTLEAQERIGVEVARSI
jgi:hypothetical protein